MLGGLHIEMALWSTMGYLLRGSGWPEAMKDAGVVKTDAAAAAFPKATNVMRPRYAHQVTVVVLDSLLKRVYKDHGSEVTLRICFCQLLKKAQHSNSGYWYTSINRLYTCVSGHIGNDSLNAWSLPCGSLCFCVFLSITRRITPDGFQFLFGTWQFFPIASR